jgi:hypothetical protein
MNHLLLAPSAKLQLVHPMDYLGGGEAILNNRSAYSVVVHRVGGSALCAHHHSGTRRA